MPRGTKRPPIAEGEAGASSKKRKNTDSQPEWEKSQREILKQLLIDQRPPITEDVCDAILGPIAPEFDEWWTQEDESLMMQRWGESEEKADMERMKAGSLKTRTMVLWKICLRLYRCSPFAVLSNRHGLQYQATETKAGGTAGSSMWSQDFCKLLGEIITHPIWRNDVDLLVAYLQFAVICRTEDRRPWKAFGDFKLDGLGLDDVAHRLNVAKEGMPSQSIQEILAEVRENQGEGSMRGSVYLELMQQMATTVAISKAPLPRRSDESDPSNIIYLVRKVDLQNIYKAVDSLSTPGGGTGDLGRSRVRKIRGMPSEL